MVAGVCAGLAEYFDVDTTLVRVIFVVLGLVGGSGFVAYALLWIFVDSARPTPPPAVTSGPDESVIPPATDAPPSVPSDPVVDDPRDDAGSR